MIKMGVSLEDLIEDGGSLPFMLKEMEECAVLRGFFPGIEHGAQPKAEQIVAGWEHIKNCSACLRNTIRAVTREIGMAPMPIQLTKKQQATMRARQGNVPVPPVQDGKAN